LLNVHDIKVLLKDVLKDKDIMDTDAIRLPILMPMHMLIKSLQSLHLSPEGVF